ncbi:MAG TPA: hypothetical protein EYP41_20420 [Anaerolineae bacterium]|nr:hypothetical protein [Anaerolineae bacterium]
MTKKLWIPLLLILALLGAGTAVAQSESTAVWQIPPGSYTVGDPIPLTLSVTHPAGTEVLFPQLPEEWGAFVVLGQDAPVTTPNGNGTLTTSQTIDARLFAPGNFATPPVSVTITDANGNISEIAAAPATVTIASVLTEGDTELRDIKPQAELPLMPAWAGAAAGLALAGLTGWVIYRQRKAPQPVADNRLPHEKALDELERIKGLGLPEDGRYQEHYTLVSDTMRRYVEQTYQVEAMERTTSELRRELKNSAMPQNAARGFLHLLNESDMVKFANVTPRRVDAYQLVALAEQIVETTQEGELLPADGNRFSKNGTQNASRITNEVTA